MQPTCVVKFTATWCGPCQNPKFKDAIKTYVEKYNVCLVEIDVDEHADVANHFKCTSVPLLIALKDTKEIKRCVGFSDELDTLFESVKKNKENQIVLPTLDKAQVHNDAFNKRERS